MEKSVVKGFVPDSVGIGLIIAQVLIFGMVFLRQVTLNSTTGVSTRLPKVIPTQSIRFQEVKGLPDPNAILDQVNQLRVQKGLSPLIPNAKLAEVAQTRANDMSKYNYYAHKNPQGLYYYDYLAGTAFDKRVYTCENLDLQFIESVTRFVDDWQNSNKGHRECMLNNNVINAGYAVTSLNNLPGGEVAYIVVAIHGEAATN